MELVDVFLIKEEVPKFTCLLSCLKVLVRCSALVLY